jgi:uncharacterized membrane protein
MGFESGLDNGDVPLISITFAVLMLLISLGALLFYFHHIAEGLQASRIISNVGKEIEREIRRERSFPTSHEDFIEIREEEDKLRSAVLQQGKAVPAVRSGYVRAIDYEGLLKIAKRNNIVFYLRRVAGDFIVPGDELLLAWPASHEMSEPELSALIDKSYILGDNRTIQQDIEYGMTSLVIIASRALSPAINDPITPTMCLNRLGVALSMLAESMPKSSYHYDKAGKLRVIADPASFGRMAGVSFNLIRQYGRCNADVMIYILKTIRSVAAHVHTDAEREILMQHAHLALEDSEVSLPSSYDKQRVHQAYEDALKSLKNSSN